MCASCHGPHGGPEKALLKKSLYEICETCHTEVHQQHQSADLNPDTGQPKSGLAVLPPGFPIRKKDSKLSCIGCHLPHGSDHKNMWPVEDSTFCANCHRF